MRIGNDRQAAPSDPERRDTLLAAAEQVFLARGYVSTTMADIAQAAAMSKKTIYQVFASKKELFDALMMDRLAVPRLQPEDGGRPAAAVLSSLLLDMARFVLSPKRIALTRLILAEIASTPEVGDVLKARCVQAERTMQTWLALQVSRGIFDIADIPSAAAMLFGTAFGDFHWHLLLQLGEAPTEAAVRARIERSVAVFMREFAREAVQPPS
jgi:TetR/AcrR family transcriptional regulator, regulator of autoinduction and epiphytic fitness